MLEARRRVPSARGRRPGSICPRPVGSDIEEAEQRVKTRSCCTKTSSIDGTRREDDRKEKKRKEKKRKKRQEKLKAKKTEMRETENHIDSLQPDGRGMGRHYRDPLIVPNFRGHKNQPLLPIDGGECQ